MRIKVTNPDLVRDLRAYLRQAECIVAQTDETTLEAYPRSPLEPDRARQELAAHLIDWQRVHPMAAAYLLD